MSVGISINSSQRYDVRMCVSSVFSIHQPEVVLDLSAPRNKQTTMTLVKWPQVAEIKMLNHNSELWLQASTNSVYACMCACVYVRVHMSMCMYVCMHACMHTCVVCVRLSVRPSVHVCPHARMHAYVYMCACHHAHIYNKHVHEN